MLSSVSPPAELPAPKAEYEKCQNAEASAKDDAENAEEQCCLGESTRWPHAEFAQGLSNFTFIWMASCVCGRHIKGVLQQGAAGRMRLGPCRNVRDQVPTSSNVSNEVSG